MPNSLRVLNDELAQNDTDRSQILPKKLEPLLARSLSMSKLLIYLQIRRKHYFEGFFLLFVG